MPNILVAVLTQEQYEQVHLKELQPDHAFSCAKNIDNNWVIDQTQIDQIQNDQFLWLKELPLIEYHPPIIEQSTTGSI
jgi:hypothetical protein